MKKLGGNERHTPRMLPWTQASWAEPQAAVGRVWWALTADTHRATQASKRQTQTHTHTHPETGKNTRTYLETHSTQTQTHSHTEACMFGMTVIVIHTRDTCTPGKKYTQTHLYTYRDTHFHRERHIHTPRLTHRHTQILITHAHTPSHTHTSPGGRGFPQPAHLLPVKPCLAGL